MLPKPEIIQFDKIGDDAIGYISIAETNTEIVPFEIKRVYWTYFTPETIPRGHHAHLELHQLIIAVNGVIDFRLEDRDGNKFNFILDHPSKVLYIPPGYWRTIYFKEQAVLLCLASEIYDESDYIRNYDEFKNR